MATPGHGHKHSETESFPPNRRWHGCLSLREAFVPLNLPRMAAAQGRLSDGTGGMDDAKEAEDSKEAKEGERKGADAAPLPFRTAVDAFGTAQLRPEIEIEPTRPPQRLAPFAYALEAAVVDGDDDLADGGSSSSTTPPDTRPGRDRSVWSRSYARNWNRRWPPTRCSPTSAGPG